MTPIHNAAGEALDAAAALDAPPAHCPHPKECLRVSLKEPRSFGDRRTTRWLLLNRYRCQMAQQCACNGHRVDVKT